MVQPIDMYDIFNYIKTFSVNEIAKAQKIMHGPYTGQEQDIAKVSAQGAHAIAIDLYDAMTNKIQLALHESFSFKDETQNLIKNINEIDQNLLKMVQLVHSQASTPPSSTVIEGSAVHSEQAAS